MSFSVLLAGKCGDIIYELAAVRGLSLSRGGEQARVLLLQNDGVSLSKSEVNGLVPFIETLSYVESAGRWDGSTADVSLADWFMDYDHRRNIVAELFHHLGLDPAQGKQPWLEPRDHCDGHTLVNRTGRYPNERVDWRAILAANPGSLFVGLPAECEAFQRRVGIEVPYLETPDFQALATRIGACAKLLGNQSSPLALAHGYGRPVVVETSVDHPNCIFLRPQAEYEGVDAGFVREHGF